MVSYLKTIFVVFIIFIFSSTNAEDPFSCLHLKTLCQNIPKCHGHLRHLESKCGISLQTCQAVEISDCIHCLRSIKDGLGIYNATCWCYEDDKNMKTCKHFQKKIWNHPCEQKLSDFGVENKLIELAAEDPQPIQNTLLLIEEAKDDIDVFEKSIVVKRTTRSPMATEIEQWRHELSDTLPSLPSPLQIDLTCQKALYDVCLKHISCRELWKIFRESCVVDDQNQCKMSNKDNCWQSFEGISWTGLGNCTCMDRNSDCHWIRLQTNYNKCIYELSLSGYASRSGVSSSNYVQQYQQHNNLPKNSYIDQQKNHFEIRTTMTSTTTTTSTSTTSTSTTTRPFISTPDYEQIRRAEEWRKRTQEIERERQEKIKIQRERQLLHEERKRAYEEERKRHEERRRRVDSSPANYNHFNYSTRNNWNQVHPNNVIADLRATNKIYTTRETIVTSLPKPPIDYYKYARPPYFESSATTSTTTFTTSTTSTPTTTFLFIVPTTPTYQFDETTSKLTQEKLVISSKKLEFRQKTGPSESTCQRAHKRCELNETCKWHLSEVQMRCSTDISCVRQQCASALRRFSRYVSKELAEAVTFCQCATADAECKEFQHLMYPRCLYKHFKEKPDHNCMDTIKLCKSDSYCNRRLPIFNSSCSVTSGGICDSENLSKCREVLLTIRGTSLETPCYCLDSDYTCLYEQTLLLPNNPCVEVAMEDYAKQHANDYFPSENPIKSVEKIKNKMQTFANQTTSKIKTNRLAVESLLSNSTEDDVVSEKAERKKVKVPKLTQKETVQLKSTSKKPKHNFTPDFEMIANSTELSKTTTNKPYKKKNLHTYPTDAFVTQSPPKEGGCVARNIDGSWITHYKNSVVRQYNDWSGRCSSWCECSDEEKLTCQDLSCLEDGNCQTDQTQVAFGEKLYINERGACICHSGEFICDTAADFPEELDPGLYISLGYSLQELKLFKEKVTKKFREKSGLISPDSSIVKDIVSRLQFALERVMPKDTLCRIIILDDLTHDENVVLQVQWYGVDVYTNITEPHWHVGKMEKICAPYLKKLEYTFLLEKADRYQLILSAVKQIRVYDLLDGLPRLNTAYSLKKFQFQLIFIFTISFFKI